MENPERKPEEPKRRRTPGRRAWEAALAKIRHVCASIQKSSPDEFVSEQLDRVTIGDVEARKLAAQKKRRETLEGIEARMMTVKIAVTSGLLMFALFAYVNSPNRFTALCCAAMGFSWLGDALLMQYPPVTHGIRQYFLWGMAAFFGAQVCYTTLFLRLGYALGAQSLLVVYGFIAVFVVAGIVIWACTILRNPAQMLALRVGALFYSVVVSLMAASACALFAAHPLRGCTMLLGGLLFYVSDTLIALSSFGSLRLKYPDLVIWSLYAPAQALLIAGVWLLSAAM